MKVEDFDRLAGALAAGASRRQVLKALGLGAIGGLLGLVGIDLKDRYLASATAPAELSPRVFLPLATKGYDGSSLPCSGDSPTIGTIEAARAVLATGSTSVSLSPGGCVHYQRTMSGSVVAHEEMTYAGQPVYVFDRDASGVAGQRDADFDGFFEWRTTVTYGSTPDDDTVVIQKYRPSDQALARSETYTRTGDTIHALWEELDRNGDLVTVGEFDTSRYQQIRAGQLPTDERPPAGQAVVTAGACSAAYEAKIRQLLQQAMAKGLDCLENMGATDKYIDLVDAYSTRALSISCDSTMTPTAMNDVVEWFREWSDISIIINPDKFDTYTEAMQMEILFHEMLHELALHDENLVGNPNVNIGEIDPTYACETLCFSSLATKCNCATCLKTNICDSRCAKFKDCNPNLGARCPCPTRPYYYPTCTQCLVGCPSGLICAFYSYCEPISVGCSPATCP